MGSDVKRKETFGSAHVDFFSPALPDAVPPAMNMVLSFEEALKLHLSLGQLLGHLNGYNRSTSDGKRTAVNLCLYTKQKRIAVVEGRLKKTVVTKKGNAHEPPAAKGRRLAT